MRKLVNAVAILATLNTTACSTTGGMYSSSSPTNNEFSYWKTAGAVLLGVVTLGAIGAAAYAGSKDGGGGGSNYVSSNAAVWRAPSGRLYCVNKYTGEFIHRANCGG